MKTAVIYARYSSDKQTEQSIEGQLRVCNDYAQRNDIVVVDTYIDRAMTGTNDNRTDFQRMLKDSNKRAWDIVLVYKLDRFSRNKYETAMHKKTLRDNGIKLVSAMENIPDTPEGIILESLLEGMAEYYSAELAQKVARGMNESRQKGQFTGGHLVYGYKVKDKKIYVDEDEAKIVRQIYENYASGVCVKEIIQDLTSKGIYNHGKPFAMNTVYKILKNEKYIGILRHKDEVFKNIYQAIVPINIFNIVRNKVEANHYGKHQKDVVYLLKNKVICGYCGKPVSSESGTSSNGKVNRYYKCRGKKQGLKCENKAIRKETLEEIVIETTMKVLTNKDNLENIVNRVLEMNNQKLEDKSEYNILIKEKQTISKSIENILNAIEQGVITSSTKNRLEELEQKLANVENGIETLKAKEKLVLTKEDVLKYIKSAMKKEMPMIIQLLIDKVVVFNDSINIYFKYTDKKVPDESQDFLICTEIYKTEYSPYLISRDYILFEIIVNAYI